MPQRFLRPGITTSDAWNSVSWEAQSLFIRILTLVDDFGRYDARVPILHGQCFALRPDIKPQRTEKLRSELHKANLIQVYTVEGKDYLQVLRWQERARCESSKFPDPQESAADRSGPQPSAASLASTSSPVHPRSSPSPTPSGAKPGHIDEENENASSIKARPGSEVEVVEFALSLGLPESDGRYFWDKWQGGGFVNAGRAMRDWRATIRSWKHAGHCPSQKMNGRTLNGNFSESVASLEKRIAAAQSEIRAMEKDSSCRVRDPSKEFPPFTPEAQQQINTLKQNIDTWKKNILKA